jgi:hypothetical protein
MSSKNLIPEIKRTRAYLLYDTSGKRYLDFYQDSGRAVLGHRMEGISRVIKSTVARGLTPDYPSIYTYRVEKQLKLLFPDVLSYRIFSNLEKALSALSNYENKEISVSNFIDFPGKPSKYAYWRPFLDKKIPWNKFDYIIPVLPFPGSFGPTVVLLNKKADNLAPSDLISPFIADLLVKSTAIMIKFSADIKSENWDSFNSPVWMRVGPYLRFKIEGNEYSSLYNKALKSSVLLPPESDVPGIIPAVYEEGQIKKFINMIRSEYGN